MDRREFFSAGKKAENNHFQSAKSLAVTSGLQPYSGSWTKNEVTHLLKRTMFGAKPADVQYFLGKTMNEAVNELLNPSSPLPAPPVKNYTTESAIAPDNDVAMGTTWVNSFNSDGVIRGRRFESLKSWWLGCMINQDRSIREKMTLFWHNHFATETQEIIHTNICYKHVQLLKADSLGNFKQLVKDITLDSAMLFYLNGRQNTGTSPDENYARELQELFTLGKENNPNYTEEDVQATAKVLTGWQVTTNASPFASYFNIARHDKTNKQFSSFYNNAIITGRSDANAGNQELDDLLNLIFSKTTEVSRFIVRKLYRFFVYYDIDATVEANIIEPLALILWANNWEIKPTLSALFKSEHFYDSLFKGSQIKSSIDHIVSVCREWNIAFPNAATEYVHAYAMWNYLYKTAANAGQELGDPPNVSGWPAYYQIPQYYELWINTDTLPKRNTFTDLMIEKGYTQDNKTIIIDAVAFTQTLSNPSDPNQLINEVLSTIYSVDLLPETKAQLKKDFLLTGQDQDYYWTNAWNAYISNPTSTNFNIINTRLKDLYKYFMNLAEYQLM